MKNLKQISKEIGKLKKETERLKELKQTKEEHEKLLKMHKKINRNLFLLSITEKYPFPVWIAERTGAVLVYSVISFIKTLDFIAQRILQAEMQTQQHKK